MRLMGILNVTPDSFCDGGLTLEPWAAIEAGLRMVEEGADLIDVGGESTRPGAAPVDVDEELRRVAPVVADLAARDIAVSIDTRKPAVAREALRAGAVMVNDVTALRDPEMREVCSRAGCEVCLVHMRGEPPTMQHRPEYLNVVEEVRAYLLEAASRAEAEGVLRDRIWVDPGIGFGKTTEHNVELLRHLRRLAETGYPVLVGASRKTFLGRILGSREAPLPPEERLEGTLAAHVLAQAAGARMIRAHDVLAARRAMDVAQAILGEFSTRTIPT